MYNFGEHAKETKKRVGKKTNVLKCLAGTTWGKSKEVLLDTYKAIGRSIINYAAPIWTPQLSATNWTSLDAAQNAALRVATGCTAMSATTHLNQESKILPVKEHNSMLTEQYLLSMHRPHHPNHHVLSDPTPPRDKRRSILDLRSNLAEGISDSISEPEYKMFLKQIHSQAVNSALQGYPSNRVLHRRPPDVNDREERELPRHTRCILAQLRSGHSSFLNEYLHRINKSDSDKCPKCLTDVHSSIHLFNCPADPTALTAEDLWLNPRAAAQFLGLPLSHDEPPDG